ncbi:MAG: preprotein translocase subunit SecG [Caldisericaceae bacterium]
MSTFAIVLVVLDLVFALGTTISILLMDPKGAGLGAISGGATVFHNKTAKDILLERLAIVFGILFVLTTVFLNVFKVF